MMSSHLGVSHLPLRSDNGNWRWHCYTSDDDYGNYAKAVEALSAEVAAGRWPDVKITVLFTGKNHPTEEPRVEIITPDGSTRLATDTDRHGLPR